MHGVGFTPHPDPGVGQVHCAVITVSDTRAHPVADGIYPEDPGGELLQSQLGQAGHLVVDYRRVPDEQRQIREAVNAIADLPSVQVILLTGGTGIAPRDVTCESIAGTGWVKGDGLSGDRWRLPTAADLRLTGFSESDRPGSGEADSARADPPYPVTSGSNLSAIGDMTTELAKKGVGLSNHTPFLSIFPQRKSYRCPV
jgi:molybdenum cofactor synthesis domain-containing protein